jgi:hypothetical protein
MGSTKACDGDSFVDHVRTSLETRIGVQILLLGQFIFLHFNANSNFPRLKTSQAAVGYHGLRNKNL